MAIINIQENNVLVDDEDIKRITQYNWWRHSHKSNDRYIYFRGIVNNKYIYLHRFIMNAYDSNLVVDHINHKMLS